MSSEQRPLSAFDAPADPEPDPEPPAVRTRQMTPESEQQCQGCGASVSAEFRRVMGDNQNRVHACPNCTDKFGSGRQFAGLEETTDSVHGIGGGES